MNELQKLRVLISHWIDHNEEHAAEFRRWFKEASDAAGDIFAAAASPFRIT